MTDQVTNTEDVEVARPESIQDLHPKMRLAGRVTKIDLYGAFVDIGIGRDALIHISKMSTARVNRVSDILNEGDDVKVYVDAVDPQLGRVSLTMLKPHDVSWSDLRKGQIYPGRIARLEQYGAFVEIGAARPGLLHVSQMGDEFVRHPRELYTMDQEVLVQVLDFDRQKRRIDLALADDDQDQEPDEDEAEEEALTSMELALRRALEDGGSEITLRPREPRRTPRRRTTRSQQDDILSRTLRERKS